MSDNSISLDMTVDRLIIEIREQFLRERYAIGPNNYDPIDIEKLKTKDYTIKRFVVNQDLNKVRALNQLDEAMKWRKSFGVNHIDCCDFFVEIFETGAYFICNTDMESRPVVYIRTKACIRFPLLKNIVQRGFVFLFDKMDEMAGEKGCIVFQDCTDGGFKNFDLKLAQFTTKILRDYFPGALKLAILYNLPPIWNIMISLVKPLMGTKYSNSLKVISRREEIFDCIDKENVPTFLGGECDMDFSKPPPNCTLTFAELAVKHSIDADDARKFVKLLEPIIHETKLLVNGERV